MSNPAPLLIIVGTIAFLILIQQLLHWLGASQASAITKPARLAPRGRLFSGLTVSGLNPQEIHRLRELIIAGDLPKLTTFLALHKVSVVELDKFLQQAKHKALATRPQGRGKIRQIILKTLIGSSSLSNAPAGIRFDILNNDEHLQVLSHESKNPRIITYDFMQRFGAEDFQRHFSEYNKYKKPLILNIPGNDPKRPLFEKLVESGIAEKGHNISLAQRLTLLSLKQLQQMAKDLNLKRELNSKTEAVKALTAIPGARVLFSRLYTVDDLFHLVPASENNERALREWGFLNAYAKLLCSIADKTLPSSAQAHPQ